MEIAPWRIRSLTKLVYSQPFELLIAFVILINATSLAILTMPDLDPQVRDACEQIDLICFAIYGAELVLRILSYGKKWNRLVQWCKDATAADSQGRTFKPLYVTGDNFSEWSGLVSQFERFAELLINEKPVTAAL